LTERAGAKAQKDGAADHRPKEIVMDSTLKHSSESTALPSLDKIANDITALRRDISALASQVKSGALKGASDAVDEIGERAKHIYGNLADQGERSAKALGQQVKEQPLLSLLIAFGLGLVSSRFLSSR
jgi:hypothetical protein